jgi:hypothetical protein
MTAVFNLSDILAGGYLDIVDNPAYSKTLSSVSFETPHRLKMA